MSLQGFSQASIDAENANFSESDAKEWNLTPFSSIAGILFFKGGRILSTGAFGVTAY